MKGIYILATLLLVLQLSFAQDAPKKAFFEIDTTKRANVSFGLDFQAYPTGFIPGVIIDATFENKNAMILRLGYNWFNHKSLGVHDSEKGSGLGFSLGYRRYLEEQGLKGFFVGLRTDFWFSSVEWTENINNDRTDAVLVRSGSDIIVIQPVLETGYKIKFPNDIGAFVPTIGFGYEFNASTQGDLLPPLPNLPPSVNLSPDTGEGLIFLAEISIIFKVSRDAKPYDPALE